jgi:serine protease AprX
MARRVFWFTVGALVCSSAVCAFAQRIDPKLYTLASTQERLRVLIVLTRQPQRDMVRQVEEYGQERKSAARIRLAELMRAPFSLAREVDDARAELDRINLDIRRRAIEETRLTIQPQQDSLAALLRLRGATNVHPYAIINAIAAEVPSALLPELAANPDVATVAPFMKLYPQLNVSVPAILAPPFWSAFSRGAGESVGVLDSGIDTGNSGFNGLQVVGHISLTEGAADPCFADNATTYADSLGHGTHVAGIVASQGGSSCPTCIGVAPGITTLYALKIGWLESSLGSCPGGGSAYDQDVLDAIDWAIANTSVNVFNFSYGGSVSGDDDNLSQLFDQIGDVYGVNIVSAAGNAGNGGVESPGISYNGVTAASMDDQHTTARDDDVVSSFSSRGPTSGGRFKPDISAPGNHGNGYGGINSTCMTSWGLGGYCQMAGTSMASPHVAGSLALIRSAGAADALAAKAVLLNSAYNAHSGWQADSGWGFVDLKQASLEIGNCISGTLTAGAPAFYAGTVSGGLKTTLVWNRHVTGNQSLTLSMSNLDLYAYDGAGGSALGSSTSTIQNVEQVVAADTGTVVLSVVPLNIAGGGSEPYALGISSAGFARKNGPALTVSCTGPSGSVPTNAVLAVPCVITNNGDLTAFDLTGALNWQGSSGGTVNPSGNAGPAQQTPAQSWQIVAPSTSGHYTFRADVSSTSYGRTYTATTTVAVAVAQAYTLTAAASPSNAGVVTATPSATGGVYAAGTRVCMTAAPNTGWTFSSWSGAALDSSNCLTVNGNSSVTANFTAALSAAVPTMVLSDPSGAVRLSAYPSATLSNSGGLFASDPSAADDSSGRTFVTARDNYNSVWANVYNPGTATWVGWQFGGGSIQGVPSIAVDAGGTGWIASRDSWNSYWLVSYTTGSGFGSWIHLAGVFSTDPLVTACANGSIYVIGKDNWNALWSEHYIPGSGLQGWVSGGGVVKGKPAATCGSDNAVYVVVQDNWSSNWVARVAGNTWTGWFNGGAVTAIDPRIAELGGSAAVVILDGGGGAWTGAFAEGTGNGWQGWVRLGGVLVDVASAGVGGKLYLAGKAPGGDLWWWQQTGNQWTWIGNNGVAAGALAAAPR